MTMERAVALSPARKSWRWGEIFGVFQAVAEQVRDLCDCCGTTPAVDGRALTPIGCALGWTAKQ